MPASDRSLSSLRCHDLARQPAGPYCGRERRIELLIQWLPPRIQSHIRWLRRPSSRWVRIVAGVLLMIGSLFSVLPVFGLWMLPLGLVLLAEDIAPLRRTTDRVLIWIEQRRPHWLGLKPVRGG